MQSWRSIFAILFLVLLPTAGTAVAAVHRDLPYRDAAGRLQSLDVYAPDLPGPHPVVVYFHGGRWQGGDKSDIQAKPAAFLAHGYVFVSVNYRLAPAAVHPAQLEDAASAVAWVVRRIAEFGGDPDRVHLMGQEAGAQLAALLAADARALAAHDLGPRMLRGVLLLDPIPHEPALDAFATNPTTVVGKSADARIASSPATHIDARNRLPPAMLYFSGADDAVRLQAERLAERWRGAGASAQLQTSYASVVAGVETDFGTPGDPTTVQAFAWLRSLEVPRVQRFENLVFELDPGLAKAGALAAGAASLLRAHAGALYAGAPRASGQAASPGVSRILRKRAATDDWETDVAFAQDLIGLETAAFATDAAGADVSPPRELLLAFLSGPDGDVHVASRAASGATWTTPLALSLERKSAATTLIAAAHRDAVTGLAGFFVAASGAPPILQRLQLDSDTDAIVAANGTEGPQAAGPILALAVANGVLHAAIGRAGHDRGGLYRRIDGVQPRWEKVAAWSASGPVHSLAAVAEPHGKGYEVLIGTSERDTVERIDPREGYAFAQELDFRAAFRGMWLGLGSSRARAGSGFIALRQPESNDVVHVLPLALAHPAAAAMGHGGGYYLVRQLDASYSYGLAHDFAEPQAGSAPAATIRRIVASPFVEEAGSAFYFAGEGEGAKPFALRARLNRAAPPQGLWWDRAHPGHGLALHRVGERWLATLYTFDAAGEPVWYAALGTMASGRFVADDGGLARYRRIAGEDERYPHVSASGRIALDFAAATRSPGCRDKIDRRDAATLAALRLELDGRTVDWCVEPIAFGGPGVPVVDGSGLWSGGAADGGWGVMLQARGYEGSTREAAIVFFHDGQGDPRWALALGDAARGAASLELRSYSGPCPGCAPGTVSSRPAGTLSHRLQGYCGEVSGNASIELDHPGPAGGRLLVENARVQPLSTQRCY